jgi:hypothetical protein
MEPRANTGTSEAAGTGADQWRDFHDKFQALAEEQSNLLREAQKGDRRLRAYCGYNSDATPDESELVRQGLLCLLYRIESGTWQLGEGPTEAFRARFVALATRAGIAIHPPHGIAADYFWLHHLCSHLRRIESKDLFGRSDTGGYIEDVCRASAMFCSWLETRALDTLTPTLDRSPRPNRRPKGTVGKSSAAARTKFAHSPDYRSVTLQRKLYCLTPRQAQVVEILHEAHQSGNTDVSIAYILEQLETPGSRWQDTFKSNPQAKKALIKSGERKGTLRLNI